jgi:hypothetical protein
MAAGCGPSSDPSTEAAPSSDDLGTAEAKLEAPLCISRRTGRDFSQRAKGIEYVDVRNNCGYGPIRVRAIWWLGFPSGCISLRPGQSARLYGNGVSWLAGVSYC